MIDHALLPALNRFRSRAALTAQLGITLPVACVSWGVVDLARVLALDPAPGRRALTLPLALAIAAAVALVTWMRRPEVAQVARVVDDRLGLRAAVVTALQFHGESDPFAVHTVDRAVDGLRRAQPGDVYPWTLPRSGQVLVLAGLLASTGAIALHPRAESGLAGTAATGPGGTPAGRSARPGNAATASRPNQAGTAEPAPDAVSSSGARQPAPATPDQRNPQPPEPTSAAAVPAAPAATGAGSPTGAPHEPGTQATSTSPGAGARAPETALTAGGQGSGPTQAPGGGRTGGRDRGSNPTRAGDEPATGATTSGAAPDEHALSLERVPMSRRTYVQRYLHSLSRAEPR